MPVAPALAEPLSRDIADVDLVELYFEGGWTDGLPVVPPTQDKVDAVVAALGGDPAFVECKVAPRWGSLTREVLAVRRIRPHSWSSNPGVMALYSQKTYRRALERGNLSRRERRVARRELRHARLTERVVSDEGLSFRRAVRALPLLLLVVAEHPRVWRSLPGKLARGKQFFAPVPPPRPARARRPEGSAQAMTR